MIRLLWNGSTGMLAQSSRVDIIANNLANVNTTGFKKTLSQFQDSLYHNSGAKNEPVISSVSFLVGQGVRVAETKTSFLQGPLQETDRELDMAIEGDGFFRVLLSDGSYAYTRAGSFAVDSAGNIVTLNGEKVNLLEENLDEVKFSSISIDEYGAVCLYDQAGEKISEGQAHIYRFQNEEALDAIGNNLWRASDNSGAALRGNPGDEGFGKIAQKFLEQSNVSMIAEITRLIQAQRAYELNSRSVQTADEMWSLANHIRR